MGTNYTSAVALVSDKVQAVACVFDEDHNASTKRYTYKAFTGMDLAVGDLAIVENSQHDFGFTVVKVVDLDMHSRLLANEKAAIDVLRAADREERRRKAVTALLGAASAETLQQVEFDPATNVEHDAQAED